MVVKCEDVWREASNYLEGDVSAELHAAIEEHLVGCKACTSVVEGMRNVITLYGDENMVSVPLGFSYRLQRRIEDNLHPTRRTFFGWLVAAAAAVLVAGTFEVTRPSGFLPHLRSAHANRGRGVPPDMMVLVYPEGKTFHVAGCPYILDKTNLRSVKAREAEHEGYAPCVRCMKKYLT